MGKTILVADDDPAIVESIQLLLSEEGYTVTTTLDGTTLQHPLAQFPDLILLDIWMSGVNGGEVCRNLKAQAPTRGIPVVMLSANRDGSEIAAEAGADDFIAKPFDADRLLSVISRRLGTA